MVTLDESCSTFSVVFWMLCGKQLHTGSWAQCQTTVPSSPILQDSVRNNLLLLNFVLQNLKHTHTRILDKSIQSAGGAVHGERTLTKHREQQ